MHHFTRKSWIALKTVPSAFRGLKTAVSCHKKPQVFPVRENKLLKTVEFSHQDQADLQQQPEWTRLFTSARLERWKWRKDNSFLRPSPSIWTLLYQNQSNYEQDKAAAAPSAVKCMIIFLTYHSNFFCFRCQQQLRDRTQPPAAKSVKLEPKVKTLNGKLRQVLKLSSKVLSHVC